MGWKIRVRSRAGTRGFFRLVCKIEISGYELRHVCLSFRLHGTSRLPLNGFSWNVIYMGIFPNSVEKIQDSLRSDENNGHFTWRPIYIFDHIWLKSSYSEKCFRRKLYRKHILCSIKVYSENRIIYEIMWRNIAKPDGPQMTISHGACTLHAGYLRLQTHTLRICNSYCFSTATMVTGTRLNVTLYLHCLLFSLLPSQCRLWSRSANYSMGTMDFARG